MSAIIETTSSESPAHDDDACPVETVIDIIGGKWKVLIVWHLQSGALRFTELQRALPGVSAKVLSQQLRQLERDGIASRRVIPTVPPQVEYSLTDLGRTLRGPLDALCAWGEHVLETRGAPSLHTTARA